MAVGLAGAVAPAAMQVTTDTTFDTIDAERWDELVGSMPRPTPFLLHGWLVPWWRHYGAGREPAIHVSRAGGRLAAALPLMVGRTCARTPVARFVGAPDSTLADIVAPAETDERTLHRLLDAAVAEHRLLDLYSLAPDGHLASILPARCLRTRTRAPVMDMRDGWEDVFARKTSGRRRALYRRRWRQLRAAGPVELSVATEERDVAPALEDAFRIHALRWRGRPDVSTFADERGREFNRAAMAALARSGCVRMVTLRVAGAPVAFTCSLHTGGRMFLYRLAFDPQYGRCSPGILVTLEAIRLAAEEGATHVEFLRGTERYKTELGDRFDVLSEAVVARGGRAQVAKALVNGGTRANRAMVASRRAGRQLAKALAFRSAHNG